MGCQPGHRLDITSLIETRWFRGYCDMLNIVSSKARGEASMSAKNGSIKLVAGNSNPALAQEIADWLHLPLTKAIVRRFADMEIFVEIQENVRGSDVFVIQSTSFPANDHLMELLIITDALRRASARRITAVIPYFGYARQDRKAGPRTPISAKLVANLITRAGADRVMTLDLHAGQIQGFFDIPTDNLYASPVMVRDIRERFDLTNVMVVSPDVGGVVRARGLAKRINAPLAIIDKRRERAGESEVMNVIGDVAGYTCILVDDIVDSGGTLVNAADALLANGAKDVYAYITHGVLSGGAAARITGSRLKELVITDSIQPTEAVRNARQHPHAVDRLADRRSHRPHRVGRVGVEPVRLERTPRHSGAHRRCEPGICEILRCAIAHLRFDASHRPGMTEVLEPGFRSSRPNYALHISNSPSAQPRLRDLAA